MPPLEGRKGMKLDGSPDEVVGTLIQRLETGGILQAMEVTHGVMV